MFDENKKCYLYTDASKIGVGGVSKQMQKGKELHPVGYYSKSLKEYQKRYTATELELLAIVNCADFWHQYLYSKKFVVITDHQALKYLNTFKEKNLRLTK